MSTPNAYEVIFSQDEQEAVIGVAMSNPTFFSFLKQAGIDRYEFFQSAPDAARIFAFLLEFSDKYKKLPAKGDVLGSPLFGTPTDGAKYRAALDRATALATTVSLEAIKQKVSGWGRALILKSAEDALTVSRKGQDIEVAQAWLYKAAQDLRNFQSSSTSLDMEHDVVTGLAHRTQLRSDLIMTGIPFFDDAMGGISPEDLIVLTAYSGYGKTSAMTTIAWNMAKAGRKVHFFALEASDNEIGNRVFFQEVVLRRHAAGERGFVEYGNWIRGHIDLKKYEEMVLADPDYQAAARNFGITYKQGVHYGIEQLERDITTVADTVDIAFVDHLHYVDHEPKKTETEALKQIMHRIRDVNRNLKVPIVLAAHVKKPQEALRFQTLMPAMHDIYGSMAVYSVATWVWAVAPSPMNMDDEKFPRIQFEAMKPGGLKLGYPTLVRCLKSRDFGSARTKYTLVGFWRLGNYVKTYTVGHCQKADTQWIPAAVAPDYLADIGSRFPKDKEPPFQLFSRLVSTIPTKSAAAPVAKGGK